MLVYLYFYTIYKENNNFHLFWAEFFFLSFKKCNKFVLTYFFIILIILKIDVCVIKKENLDCIFLFDLL